MCVLALVIYLSIHWDLSVFLYRSTETLVRQLQTRRSLQFIHASPVTIMGMCVCVCLSINFRRKFNENKERDQQDYLYHLTTVTSSTPLWLHLLVREARIIGGPYHLRAFASNCVQVCCCIGRFANTHANTWTKYQVI